MVNLTEVGKGLSSLMVEDTLCRTAVVNSMVLMGPEVVALKVTM